MNRKNRNRLWLPLGTAALLALLALPGAMAPASAQTGYWIDSGGGVTVTAPDDAHRAYLGVQLEEELDHSEGGARVTRVVDDSPADRAGLRKGDIIVGFDGKTIRGPVALTRQIHAAEPGDTVSLGIVRDGKRSAIEVEVGERKSAWSIIGGNGPIRVPSVDIGRGYTTTIECDDDEEDCSSFGTTFSLGDCEGEDCGFGLLWSLGRPVLGVELVEVTDELREHLGGSRGAGVLVSKIVSGMPAERAGLEVGDLIVSVAGDEVKNTRDLRRVLADKRGKTFQVEVVRDRTLRSVEVAIPAPDDDRPTGPRARVFAPRPAGVPRAVTVVPAPPAPPAAPSALALSAPRAPAAAAAPQPPPAVVAPAPRIPRPPVAPAPPAAPRADAHVVI